MLKVLRLPLLAASALVLTAADDAALAAKLVGTWEGKWQYENASGRLVVQVTSASGNALKGRSTWYATVAGDFDDSFRSAKLKDGKLKVVEATMDFEATVSEDGTAMEGTWTSPMATGPMKLAKKEDRKAEEKK